MPSYTLKYMEAEELIRMYNSLNLIFKDELAIGTLVNTSEGFCAEYLPSADHKTGEWLWPDEYPGEDGFYDLWAVLSDHGYKIWPGCISDRTVSLANWLYEQGQSIEI